MWCFKILTLSNCPSEGLCTALLSDIILCQPSTLTLSPRPVKTEQQRQKSCSTPHCEMSPLWTARCSLTRLAEFTSLNTHEQVTDLLYENETGV